MWRISFANLHHKPGRFIATTLAVIVGTGFLAGALVLRDSLGPALASNQSIALKNVSVVVLPLAGNDTGPGGRQSVQQTLSVPATLLPKVQSARGVAAAAGIATGPLKLLGANNSTVLTGLTGQGWVSVPQLNPFTVVQGSAPTQSGQVTFDTDTAEKRGISVGNTVTLATTTGAKTVTVVGLTNFGEKISSNPEGDVLVNPTDTFTFLTSGRQQFDAIYALGDPGADPSALASTVSSTVGSGFEVQTGAAYLQLLEEATQVVASTIGTGLQVFAYVALAVAVLIIYNTFTIIVTQRTRELALLRAIGASGKQIKRAIRWEAIIVGLVASGLGIVLGILLFLALTRLVPQFKSVVGNDIGVRLTPSALVQVLVSGTLITFVSSVVPGWRAARTPPVAAMRVADIDRSATSKARMVTGAVLLISGVVLLGLGAAWSQALVVGLGTVVAFLSVLIGGPVLAHYFAKMIGSPARLAGTPGHLAVENVERNARRAATTANALVIGVFLVVFVTAAGGVLRDFAVAELSKLSGADYTVNAESGSTLPPQLLQQVQSTPGVSGVAAAYTEFSAPINDGLPVGAVDFAKAEPVFGLKQAGGIPLASLADDQIAVVDLSGGRQGANAGFPALGDKITVDFNNGTAKQFEVASTFQLNFGIPAFVLMPAKAALAVDPQLQPGNIGVQVTGADPNTEQALQNLVADYSNVEVAPGNSIAQALKSIFNALINSVNALLGVAIVIALFGIVNTLVLSISERTREIGVLRAVGMSRRQLRRMVRVESVIIALLGTLVGMSFGLLVAFALVRPLLSQSASEMTWPVVHLVAIFVVGMFLGVVASIIPAFRATRLNPLEAIRDF